MSECPECGRNLNWRNAAVTCVECDRTYCKECPDYRWGRFEVHCPDCGCERAHLLTEETPPGRANKPGPTARPGMKDKRKPRRRRGPGGARGPGASRFTF